jgi:hypothetical protein
VAEDKASQLKTHQSKPENGREKYPAMFPSMEIVERNEKTENGVAQGKGPRAVACLAMK